MAKKIKVMVYANNRILIIPNPVYYKHWQQYNVTSLFYPMKV